MSLKEKYEQPMIQLVVFEQTDVIRTSFTQADNTLEDNYFDE